MFPNPTELRQMIEEAMQERAPSMYERLKADGTLQQVVAEREDAARQSYLDAVSLIPKDEQSRIQELPYLEQVHQREARNRAAAETAIEQALEFPSEDESPPQTLHDYAADTWRETTHGERGSG